MRKVTISKVNGKAELSRSVLTRNVMDFLERNEDYGNLSFDECLNVCDMATKDELVAILAELLSADQIIAIANR